MTDTDRRALLETIDLEPKDVAAQACVIVLHGLGADGNDFVPIIDDLDLDGAPPMRFVFPHAPVMPVTINNGARMRAWYDILGVDLVRREDEKGLRESLLAVRALIAREQARSIPSDRIVLAGFSQGCAMALLTGLRYDEPLAGIVGLSGYLPLLDTTTAERTAANAKTPVFLAHGIVDPVVPLSRAVASRDALLALDQPVEWHEYPMSHAVCHDEIVDIGAFLVRVLGTPAS